MNRRKNKQRYLRMGQTIINFGIKRGYLTMGQFYTLYKWEYETKGNVRIKRAVLK